MTFEQIIGGLLVSGIVAMIGLLIYIGRMTKALYDVHLGPQAIDPDSGQPRWWNNKEFSSILRDLKGTIDKNTEVMGQLLTEFRIERRVKSTQQKD